MGKEGEHSFKQIGRQNRYHTLNNDKVVIYFVLWVPTTNKPKCSK